MIICREITKKYLFSAIIFLLGISPSLIAQKKYYYLSSRDAAIVSFHIMNDQYCSSITQFDIFDSNTYTHNIYPCKIDSVLMVHAVGGYIDTIWFNKVHYILIDDTTQLHSDSIYTGSVEVEFDMEYVVLNTIIGKDVLVLNMRDGHPRPAGFLCDCEITDKETKSICDEYENRIRKKIKHCQEYSRNYESQGIAYLDSIENQILQGDTDVYISFFYDLFDNQDFVDLNKRLFYSYVMAEWYDYGPAYTRLFADILVYIKQQNTPLSNSLVCVARHYAHKSFEKDPSWYTASQLSLWYEGTYVPSEKDDQKNKKYKAIARTFIAPNER